MHKYVPSCLISQTIKIYKSKTSNNCNEGLALTCCGNETMHPKAIECEGPNSVQ